MTAETVVDFPAPFQPLFQPHRYKVYYGGRGSGKSMSFARALLILGATRPLTVLCTREIQTSINDSVHRLLREQADALGLGSFYTVTKSAIYGQNGTEFTFKGLRFNSREIKSTEGVDICWVEEGQAVSADSWDVLIPTIRKPGSEIWISFNPLDETDPTFQRFVVNPPDNAYVRKVNFDENPYFPDVLANEMEWLKKRDYQSYLHIWEGEVRKYANALVFAGYFSVEDFETPRDARFYQGADWGFACLSGDTLIMTDKGEIPIRDIRAGDMVLTRKGYRRVVAFLPRGRKKVYTVDCGNGRPITATADHRFYTADGWKRVDELKAVEKICVIQSSSMAGHTNAIPMESTRITSIVSGRRAAGGTNGFTTGICGKAHTGRFLQGVTFITSIVIRLIIALIISFVFLKVTIRKSTTQARWGQFPQKRWQNTGNNTAIIPQTGKSAGQRLLGRLKNGAAYARNVARNILLLMFIKDSVPRNAGRKATQGMQDGNTLARYVGKDSLSRHTTNTPPALVIAPISCQSQSGWEDVYDLSIEGEHEFFANGVLVHNCDPTTLIRCFIRDRKLYIDREAWGIGVEIDKTPALFDTIDTARLYPIKADCARPETISYMKRQGFRISAAKKWQGSVEDGIEFLKTFDIVIHPRCKHTIDEFNHYSYKVDKQTNDILPQIVDANNHIVDGLRYAMDGLIKGKGGMKITPKALMRAGVYR